MSSDPSAQAGSPQRPDHPLRFHAPHVHLTSAFGGDWFGRKAEMFARFFGTPLFLIAQSVLVGVWIAFNVWGLAHFDPYPFILLNLAFSTQAAYAAPLILLAQTRQADRDKALSEADAQHREALAAASSERQELRGPATGADRQAAGAEHRADPDHPGADLARPGADAGHPQPHLRILSLLFRPRRSSDF